MESDGDFTSTRVVDEDSGEEIENVSVFALHGDRKSNQLWGLFKIMRPSLRLLSSSETEFDDRPEEERD